MGSFWWKCIYKLIPEYKQLATCTIGTGNTIQLWKDDWGQGILQYEFPHLFSFCQQPDATITQWMGYEDPTDMFVTPMTIEAYQEYQLLLHIQGTVHIHNNPNTWRFGHSNNLCSVSKIYRAMFPQGCIHPIFKHIWAMHVFLNTKSSYG